MAREVLVSIPWGMCWMSVRFTLQSVALLGKLQAFHLRHALVCAKVVFVACMLALVAHRYKLLVVLVVSNTIWGVIVTARCTNLKLASPIVS